MIPARRASSSYSAVKIHLSPRSALHNPLVTGFLTHRAISVSIPDVRIGHRAIRPLRAFLRASEPSEQSWTLAHFNMDWHGETAHTLTHRDVGFSAARLGTCPTARQPDEQPAKRGACRMTGMDTVSRCERGAWLMGGDDGLHNRTFS